MAVDGRIILNASLDNLAREINIEENVQDALEVIAQYSNFADSTLLYMGTRPDSEFLAEVLQHQDLTTVGRYNMVRKKWRKVQIISFEKRDLEIKFFFYRTQPNVAEHIVEKIQSGKAYSKEDLMKIILGSTQGMSPHESLIGKQARTLDTYALDHVDLVRFNPLFIVGFQMPFRAREKKRIYTASCNF